MDFKEQYHKLVNRLDKNQISDLNSITPFDEIKLASMGSNDTEGYQIFTPEFIVKGMVKAIGENNVLDISKTILEPTSGDGAFTVYILLKRLEKLFKDDKESFEINSLKALSTIYSNEMDKELIEKQRNNIFTVFIEFAKKKKITWSEGFLDLVKYIIILNFTWGMFNSDNPIDAGLFGTEVIYKMPEAESGNLEALEFPVWIIDTNNVDYRMEGVDL